MIGAALTPEELALRDKFAGAALAGLLARGENWQFDGAAVENQDDYAELAYHMASAMVIRRRRLLALGAL